MSNELTWAVGTASRLRRRGKEVPDWLLEQATAELRARLGALREETARVDAVVSLVRSSIVEWIDPLTGLPHRSPILGWETLAASKILVEIRLEDGTRYALIGRLEEEINGVVYLAVDDVHFVSSP